MVRSRLAIVALVGALVIACGNSGSSGGSGFKSGYTVYLSADLTGPTASTGLPILSGAKAFVDYTNQQGGVNGHLINMAALDDAANPVKVKANIQQALAANALVIIGATSSAGWSPNAAFLQQSQVAAIGAGFLPTQAIAANGTNIQYIYQAGIPTTDMVAMQTSLTQDLIKSGQLPSNPRVATYRYSSPSTQSMLSLQQQSIKTNGWTMATDQTFALAATDVSAQASTVAHAKPDVVWEEVIDSIAPLTTNALRQQGYTGPILNFASANSPETFQAVHDDKFYAIDQYLSTNNTDQPGVADIAKYAKEVGDTQYLTDHDFTEGWAEASAAITAIAKCGDSCTAVKVNDELNNLGKINTYGANPYYEITTACHILPRAGIFYHWDSSKSAAVAVGTWLAGTACGNG